jgi:hypothetical protein
MFTWECQTQAFYGQAMKEIPFTNGNALHKCFINLWVGYDYIVDFIITFQNSFKYAMFHICKMSTISCVIGI